jgi:hypothetical protein
LAEPSANSIKVFDDRGRLFGQRQIVTILNRIVTGG